MKTAERYKYEQRFSNLMANNGKGLFLSNGFPVNMSDEQLQKFSEYWTERKRNYDRKAFDQWDADRKIFDFDSFLAYREW